MTIDGVEGYSSLQSEVEYCGKSEFDKFDTEVTNLNGECFLRAGLSVFCEVEQQDVASNLTLSARKAIKN